MCKRLNSIIEVDRKRRNESQEEMQIELYYPESPAGTHTLSIAIKLMCETWVEDHRHKNQLWRLLIVTHPPLIQTQHWHTGNSRERENILIHYADGSKCREFTFLHHFLMLFSLFSPCSHFFHFVCFSSSSSPEFDGICCLSSVATLSASRRRSRTACRRRCLKWVERESQVEDAYKFIIEGNPLKDPRLDAFRKGRRDETGWWNVEKKKISTREAQEHVDAKKMK